MNSINSSSSKALYVLFGVFLTWFFMYSMIYWNDIVISKGEVVYNRWLFLSNFFLLLVSVISLAFVPAKKSKIQLLFVLWILDLLLIKFRNGLVIADVPKMITWPILFMTVYRFVSDKNKRVVTLGILFMAFAVIGSVFFLSNMISEGFTRQSNLVYFPVLAIPIIMLSKNSKYGTSLLVIATVFALVSMKRSMMLAMALTWVLLLFFSFFKKGRKAKGFAISLIIGLVVYYGFNYVDQASHGFYSERFNMEDASNGREDIYDVTWFMIVTSNPSDLWLGHGYGATPKDSIMDRAAHNEFLETLYDYGIIGATLLVLFWLYVIIKWISLVRKDSPFVMSYTMSLSILLSMSMVSVLIMYNSYYNYLIIYFAAVEALEPSIIHKHKLKQLRQSLF